VLLKGKVLLIAFVLVRIKLNVMVRQMPPFNSEKRGITEL
jgi:hypothetical protein